MLDVFVESNYLALLSLALRVIDYVLFGKKDPFDYSITQIDYT